jgi:hypothetical protein
MRRRTKSGGRQPAWFAEPSAVPRKPRNVRRPCNAGPRAAGVSPPWVCTRWSVAHGMRQITCKHVSRTTGGLRPPLLRCRANVCRRKNDFCGARTHIHKSGGRQPAVVSKNASATASDLRGVVTFATAQSAPAPRGAYAPRSCVRVRMSAGEKTICAMHERICARAAGVSPPWVCHNLAVPRESIYVR